MTVLVAGATGTTGSVVARGLRDAGVAVRAMTRGDRAVPGLHEQGFEPVVADLADAASLAGAVAGVDAVYVATNASPQLPELEGALARAAVEAGVGHLVKLSVVGADAASPLTFARLHHEAEQRIRATGIAATFVRPNGFMQNTLAWAPGLAGGAVHAPVLDARWSIVDVRDIAAVAVAALCDRGAHAGETYTVTGPEASSGREQVAILAELVGRPVEAVDVPIPAAQEAMLAQGWPAWAVERMGELFELYARGEAEAVSPDVERVTGRPARTYREFAADHLAAFSGAAA